MRIPLQEYNKSDYIRKTLNYTSLQMYTYSVLWILSIGIFPAEEAVVDFSRQHCTIGKLLPAQVIKYL